MTVQACASAPENLSDTNLVGSAQSTATSVLAKTTTQTQVAQVQATQSQATAKTQNAKTQNTAQSQAARFEAWKQTFKTQAKARGYSATLLDRMIDPAKINPKAIERNKTQPEFTRPIWEYIDGAASSVRVSKGKTKLSENEALFSGIEARYGVPRYILTAIWGLESSYGNILGTHDIVSSLATFAFEGRRQKFGTEQLYAVLDLVKNGDVRPEQLTGSWAGAMGMTQFIPTTFRDYAVDYDKNGNKDLWKSKGDALGSAANYLKRSGWKAGEPVVAEVRLPRTFDYSLADGQKKSVADWVALGAAPYNGMAFSPSANPLMAKLLIPTGGNGPKFLTFKNYDAIKKYNNSTSYALGITSLSDAFRDRNTITAPWPKADLPLSFTDRKRLQESLTRLGYDTKGVDGQIGPNSRKAIRAFQAANQMPADGYATPNLLKRVLAKT